MSSSFPAVFWFSLYEEDVIILLCVCSIMGFSHVFGAYCEPIEIAWQYIIYLSIYLIIQLEINPYFGPKQ